ncbi:MAG: hypothetical protein HYZ53_10525 [Planctomycetes bacterium]|nr:hypothetical protein [Planctomycetota bacterium]
MARSADARVGRPGRGVSRGAEPEAGGRGWGLGVLPASLLRVSRDGGCGPPDEESEEEDGRLGAGPAGSPCAGGWFGLIRIL